MAFFYFLLLLASFLIFLNALLRKEEPKIKSFKGKNVLITGASSGLGRALAVQLSKKGALLTLIAIDESGLEDTLQLCKHPENHNYFACDLSDKAKVDDLIEKISPQSYEFECLCAGLGSNGIKAPTSKIFTIMDLNVAASAAFAVNVNAKLTLLMASPQAFLPIPNRALYAASKAAVLELGRCLCQDGKACMIACPMWFVSNLRSNAIGNNDNSGRQAPKNSKTADDVALEIINGALQGKREVCLDFKQKTGRLAYAVFPGIVEFVVGKFVSGKQ